MGKLPYYARRYDNPASFALIAVMAAVFVVDFFTGGNLQAWLVWPVSVEWFRSGQYWRPLTFPFAHTGVLQLLFDGILLVWIGASVERAWGSRKFLFFFFSSGILAGIVLIPQTTAGGPEPLFFGMVGSFVAITVAFAALNPYATILVWMIPMQARWLAAILVAYELFGRYEIYGGRLQAAMAIAVSVLYGYLFATRRVSLPSVGSGSNRGPSIKERFDRWQQRRRMRQWQRRVSRINRPEDLFKDK